MRFICSTLGDTMTVIRDANSFPAFILMNNSELQTQLHEQLSLSDAEVILLRLPERIRAALIARAAEIEYPTALVARLRDRSSC